jgi:hypothetical protein
MAGNRSLPADGGWRRTNPDFEVFVPDGFDGTDSENQQLIVVPTPEDTFIAVWTMASRENDDDQRIASARSTDGGETWSEPVVVDGPAPDDESGTGLASWPIAFVAPAGRQDGGHRVYCVYNKNVGVNDARQDTTGAVRCRWSDDDGRTWSDETIDFPIDSCAISHPDPDVPENWLACFQPTRLDDGTVLVPFTHWASDTFDAALDHPDLFNRQSEIRMLRLANVDASDPADIGVTTLPDGPHGLQVPHPDRPGISMAQEPSVKPLPDGRMICTMRTRQGAVYFALSDNGGRSWDTPRPLHYDPERRSPVQNPVAPAPLYRLEDGRYFLVFYNNDGTGHGASGVTDSDRVRNPAWYAIGEAVDHPTHPIRFDGPWILADTKRQSFPADRSNTRQTVSYPSFFEHEGRAYLCYPDGKHYLLGKDLTDELTRRE